MPVSLSNAAETEYCSMRTTYLSSSSNEDGIANDRSYVYSVDANDRTTSATRSTAI